MIITKTEYRMQSYKPDEVTHSVRVEFPFDIETYVNFEKSLDELAKKFGGSEGGAGTDFCTRDVDWQFPTREAAHSFLDTLKTHIEIS